MKVFYPIFKIFVFTSFIFINACGPEKTNKVVSTQAHCDPGGTVVQEDGKTKCRCVAGYIEMGLKCIEDVESLFRNPLNPNKNDVSKAHPGPSKRGLGGPYMLASGCFYSAISCDPVRNLGCESFENHVCDFTSRGGAECHLSEKQAKVGEACDNEKDLYCEPGHRCRNGKCSKLCCNTSECSEKGEKCTELFPNQRFGFVGTCEKDLDVSMICLPADSLCTPLDDKCCTYCDLYRCK